MHSIRHRDWHEYVDGAVESCSVNEIEPVLIALMRKFQTDFRQSIHPFRFSPTGAISTCCGCGFGGNATHNTKLKATKIANTLKFIFRFLQPLVQIIIIKYKYTV